MKLQYAGLIATGAVIALASAGSVLAQDNTGGGAGAGAGYGTTTSGGGTAAGGQDRRDNGFNPGWLGLIGLAGLAGLRRPQTTTVQREAVARP